MIVSSFLTHFVGGFVAGLIIPHDNGFAVALVERFEDLVSIILIPLVRHLFHLIGNVLPHKAFRGG